MSLKVSHRPLSFLILILCLPAPSFYSSCVRSPPASTLPVTTLGQKIQTEMFSMEIPLDMKEEPDAGTDSSIWRYSSKKMTLEVAYGLYPDDLKFYSNQPDYQKTFYEIDGRRAELSTFRVGQELTAHFTDRGKYIAAVYFPDLKNNFGTKLTMWANCESPVEQEIAKKIFSSIKVK